MVELGRRLFFDERVSRTGLVSCASCHDPDHAFSDPAHPSQDEFGPAPRRTMTMLDLTDGAMHSDGEFETLRDLLIARLGALHELPPDQQDIVFSRFGLQVDPYGNFSDGAPGFALVSDRVAQDGLYASGFHAAFGDETATTTRVMDALEAYSMTLRSGPTPLDRYLDGQTGAMSAEAQAGLALFTGKAGCSTCHLLAPDETGRAALRDGRYHDTGVSWRSARAAGGKKRAAPDRGRGVHEDGSRARRRHDMAFKTPSLRNVARRGPYMHDGSLANLVDVVNFYDGGGGRHAGVDRALRPLNLTTLEKRQLVSFLFELSSPERGGMGEAPAGIGRDVRVRIVDVRGEPLRSRSVSVESVGDRFAGVPVPETSTVAHTDGDGWVSFPFPPTTHARLHVDGHGLAGGGVIPDLVGEVELIAVREDQVALRVITSSKGSPKSVRAVPRAKTDDFGRPVEKREGDSILFERVRKLAPRVSLYVAKRPKDAGSVRRTLVPRKSKGSAALSQTDIDWSAGGLTVVDMRPIRGTGFDGEGDDHRPPVR